MHDAGEPRLASSYAANITLVVITLFPGLINAGAVAVAAPVIGADLGVAPDAAASLPLTGDAALAFGCVLAAELTRRMDGRTLYLWLLGLTIVSSLASAITPSFGVLVAADVVHGLVAGMLFVVALPPLLTTFKSDKLRTTASVVVLALFGAATLGPLIGGLGASPGIWRISFAAEAFVGLVALVLAPAILKPRVPQGSDQPVDYFAIGASLIGSALIYFGVGALVGHDWRMAAASGPVAGGVLFYVALIVVEGRRDHPLFPVRKLVSSLAIVGAIATIIGSASFSALGEALQLTLLRVDGLDPRSAGLAFWPEFLAAIASGYVFGRVVTTRWVLITGATGVAFIGLAALIAHAVAPVDARSVAWLSVIGGFGAGLSIVPGIFLVALSFERRLLTGAVALFNLLRLTGGFISAPGVEHTIGGRAAAHLNALAPSLPIANADALVRAFITGRTTPPLESLQLYRTAVSAAISDAYVIVTVLTITGIVAIAALLIGTHVGLCTPDLKRFDQGEPALDARVLI